MTTKIDGAAICLRRSLVQPPNLREIHPDVLEALERLSDVSSLRPVSVAEVVAIPAHRFLALRHPLSDIFMGVNGSAQPPAHIAEEQAVMAYFAANPLILGKPASLATQLIAAASIATGARLGLRSDDVALNTNTTGRRVLFPESGLIAQALADCQAAMDDMPAGIMRATAIMVMILNLHPFADGNGRTARCVFNHLIIQIGYRDYFPLSSIIARSQGGFELAVRTVEIKRDWNPILRYMLAALALGSVYPTSPAFGLSAHSTLLRK